MARWNDGSSRPQSAQKNAAARTSPDRVRLWSNTVTPYDAARLDGADGIRGGGTESVTALWQFVKELPPEAKLTVITDQDGQRAAASGGPAGRLTFVVL